MCTWGKDWIWKGNWESPQVEASSEPRDIPSFQFYSRLRREEAGKKHIDVLI